MQRLRRDGGVWLGVDRVGAGTKRTGMRDADGGDDRRGARRVPEDNRGRLSAVQSEFIDQERIP